MNCEQCGVEYTRGGRIHNRLCAFCYVYGEDCVKCPINSSCIKYHSHMCDPAPKRLEN